MDKSALRSHYRALRRSISTTDANMWSDFMAYDLRKHLRQKKFEGVLFLYFPIQGEPDLLRVLSKERIQVALPRIEMNRMMNFYLWSPGDPLKVGSFGIREPSDLSHPVTPRLGDAAVIPALAIDRHGNRLGYGGGYYDRWLAHVRGKLIFVAGAVFPPFICDDDLPCASYDQKVDFVLASR